MRTKTWLGAAAVLLGIGTAAGCGGSEVRPTADRVLVRVDPDDSVEDVTRKAHAAVGGGRDCILVWGDVVTQPADATPVRLEWAELEHIDGYVLCGDDANLVMLDPRAQHLAMLYYRDRQLMVGPPAAGGVTPLRATTLAFRGDGPAPCLSVFDPNSSDRDVPAFVVLRQLRDVPQDFLIAAMPVDARVGTAGDEAEVAAK